MGGSLGGVGHCVTITVRAVSVTKSIQIATVFFLVHVIVKIQLEEGGHTEWR